MAIYSWRESIRQGGVLKVFQTESFTGSIWVTELEPSIKILNALLKKPGIRLKFETTVTKADAQVLPSTKAGHGLHAENVAKAYGAVATVNYRRIYPPTINHKQETDFAVRVAASIVGSEDVDPHHKPIMGSEDFSFMLEERPGNIMLIGNGASAHVHHPAFDFDDAALAYGIAYFAQLVEVGMPI